MLYLQLALVLLSFAANSLLTRWALDIHQFDPALFTFIRLFSGALMLSVLLKVFLQSDQQRFSVRNATSDVRFWILGSGLLIYALGFSWAYLRLDTGVGAFILFASVQISMLVMAFYQGNRLNYWQWIGIVVSLAGLAWLLLPQANAPDPISAIFMFVAALGWAGFVAMGKASRNPLADVHQAFVAAAIMMVVLLPFFFDEWLHWNWLPWLLAVLSGALASGLGYFLWYRILPELGLSKAAQFQLLVPVLAMLMGLFILGESLSVSALAAMVVIIIGVTLSVVSAQQVKQR